MQAPLIKHIDSLMRMSRQLLFGRSVATLPTVSIQSGSMTGRTKVTIITELLLGKTIDTSTNIAPTIGTITTHQVLRSVLSAAGQYIQRRKFYF